MKHDSIIMLACHVDYWNGIKLNYLFSVLVFNINRGGGYINLWMAIRRILRISIKLICYIFCEQNMNDVFIMSVWRNTKNQINWKLLIKPDIILSD